MTTPYRGGAQPGEIMCPRCTTKLPPTDVSRCPAGCGVWVTIFAATEIFDEREYAENRSTRWSRVREPCPVCTDKMTLRGDKPALFQGCDVHGFWVDDDTIQHTGLARDGSEAKLERKRNDRQRVEAERARLDRLASERARAREARLVGLARDATGNRAEQHVNVLDEAVQRRNHYAALLAALVIYRNPEPLIDELTRLDDLVRSLVQRLDDLERR